jgi:hypothetical protein
MSAPAGQQPQRPQDLAHTAELLRAACATLAHSTPAAIPAISVSIGLDGRPGTALLLIAVARRLGEQHGLRLVPRLDGGLLTLRYEHRATRSCEEMR